jgi:hypothetical protein
MTAFGHQGCCACARPLPQNEPKKDPKPSPAATAQLPVSTGECNRSGGCDGAFSTKNSWGGFGACSSPKAPPSGGFANPVKAVSRMIAMVSNGSVFPMSAHMRRFAVAAAAQGLTGRSCRAAGGTVRAQRSAWCEAEPRSCSPKGRRLHDASALCRAPVSRNRFSAGARTSAASEPAFGWQSAYSREEPQFRAT